MKGYKIEAGQSSVNPIRDTDDLYNCINYFKKLRDTETNPKKQKLYDRNYMLFLLGIYLWDQEGVESQFRSLPFAKEMQEILTQEKQSQKMLEDAGRGIGYGID